MEKELTDEVPKFDPTQPFTVADESILEKTSVETPQLSETEIPEDTPFFDPTKPFKTLNEDQLREIDEKNRKAASEAAVPKEILENPKTNYEKLAAKLVEKGLYPGAQAAFNTASDKGIYKVFGGEWEAPAIAQIKGEGFLNRLATAVTGAGNVLGAPLGLDSQNDDVKNLLQEFQDENNLSYKEMQITWRDLNAINRSFERDEKTRSLSDGTLLVNELHSDFLDRNKAIEAINKSNASQLSKANYIQNIDEVIKQTVNRKMQVYEAAAQFIEGQTLNESFEKIGIEYEDVGGPGGKNILTGGISPKKWAIENDRLDDIGTAQFIKDYEKDVIEGRNAFQDWTSGLLLNLKAGPLKVIQAAAGLTGYIAGLEGISKFSGDLSKQVEEAKAGSFDTGLTGALIEELPSIYGLTRIAKGAGSLGAFTGKKLAGEAAEDVIKASSLKMAKKFATGAMPLAGGLQSAGLTFSNEIANGATIDEARDKATGAGLTTTFVMSIFQLSGLSGMEGEIAKRYGVQNLTKRDITSKVSPKMFESRVKDFSLAVAKASAAEGAEEFADELFQQLVNADEDTPLGDILKNAKKAGAIGAFIGGSINVAGQGLDYAANRIQRTPDQDLTTPGQLSQRGLNKTATALEGATLEPVIEDATEAPPTIEATQAAQAAGATQTQQPELGAEMQPQTPTPLSIGASVDQGTETTETTQEMAPEVKPFVQVTIGGHSFNAPSNDGKGVAEAVFGKAPDKEVYPDNVSQDQFRFRPIPGMDGQYYVAFDQSNTGDYLATNKGFNPETGEFYSLQGEAQKRVKSSSKQEILIAPKITTKVANESILPKQEQVTTTPNAPIAAGNIDNIDTSPATFSAVPSEETTKFVTKTQRESDILQAIAFLPKTPVESRATLKANGFTDAEIDGLASIDENYDYDAESNKIDAVLAQQDTDFLKSIPASGIDLESNVGKVFDVLHKWIKGDPTKSNVGSMKPMAGEDTGSDGGYTLSGRDYGAFKFSFTLIGKPTSDANFNLKDGISGILVNPNYEFMLPRLREMYPGTNFVTSETLGQHLESLKSPAQGGKPTPTPVSPSVTPAIQAQTSTTTTPTPSPAPAAEPEQAAAPKAETPPAPTATPGTVNVQGIEKKGSIVQAALRKVTEMGANVTFAKNRAEAAKQIGGKANPFKRFTTPHAQAYRKADGSIGIILFPTALKFSDARLTEVINHEIIHLAQYAFEATPEGRALADKAALTFEKGSPEYDKKFDDLMRKEYEDWDKLPPRNKVREASRAAIEMIQNNETTNFKPGFFSYLKSFFNHLQTVFAGDSAISQYISKLESELNSKQSTPDAATPKPNEAAAAETKPMEVKAPVEQKKESKPQAKEETKEEGDKPLPVSALKKIGDAIKSDPFSGITKADGDSADIASNLIARAANGDSEANVLIDSLKDEKLKAVIKKEVERLSPIGAGKAVNLPAPEYTSGSIKITKDNLASTLKTDGKKTFFESGGKSQKADADNKRKVNRVMGVGSVVEIVNDKNEVIGQKIVTFTERMPDGTVRSYLKDVAEGVLPKLLKENRKDRKAAQKIAASVFRSIIANPSLDNLDSINAIKMLVSDAIKGITSESFVRDNVIFINSPGSGPMYVNTDSKGVARIYVNIPDIITEAKVSADSIGSDKGIAFKYATADFAATIRQIAFEEVTHKVVLDEIGSENIIRIVRASVGTAESNSNFWGTMATAARWHLGQNYAFGGGALGAISDADVITLMKGKEIEVDGNTYKATKADLDNLYHAVGNEAIAELIQLMKTGNSVTDVRAQASRWIAKWSAVESKTDMAAMRLRLTELANRIAEAVSRFFKAHDRVNALPQAFKTMVLTSSSAFNAKGFIAPDDVNIVQQSMVKAQDVFNQIDAGFSRPVVDAKNRLKGIHDNFNRDKATKQRVVFLDPDTGALFANPELPEEIKKEVNEQVNILNSGGRTEVVLELASIANSVRTALSQLNFTGKQTRPVFKEDPFETIKESTRNVATSIKNSIEGASDDNLTGFFGKINDSISARFRETGPAVISDFAIAQRLIESNPSLKGDLVLRGKIKELEDAADDVTMLINNTVGVKPETLEKAADRLNKAQSELKTAFDAIVEKGGVTGATLRFEMETIRQDNLAAIARFNESAKIPEINTLGELLNLYDLKPALARSLVIEAYPDSAEAVFAALDNSINTFKAIYSVSEIEKLFDFYVIGGTDPRWQRPTPNRKVQVVNADVSAERNLGYPNWSFVFSGTPDSSDTAFAIRDAVKGVTGITPPGTDLATFDQVEDVDPVALLTDRNALPAFVNKVALSISKASATASRVLGFEPNSPAVNQEAKKLNSQEREQIEKENILGINAELIENIVAATRYGITSVDSDLMRSGGFPLEVNTDENGARVSISSPDKVIDVPRYQEVKSEDYTTGFEERILNGDVAGLIEGIVGFIERMQNASETTTTPVMKVSGATTNSLESTQQVGVHGSMTPAGLAYSLITPKLIEFLALTKNLTITDKSGVSRSVGDVIRSSSPAVARYYDSLLPSLHLSPEFNTERSDASKDIGRLNMRFWDLNRMAKLINFQYRNTIFTLKARRDADEQDFVGDVELRYPISVSKLSTISFKVKEAQRIRNKSIKKQAEPDKTIISLIQPISASRLLDALLTAQGEYATTQLQTENENERILFSSDITGNAEGGIRTTERELREVDIDVDREMDEFISTLANLEDKRASALGAIFGGDSDAILAFINKPEFTSIVNGEIRYNGAALDSWIINQLERMKAEEITSGALISGKSVDLDQFEDIKERNPDKAALLDYVFQRGFEISGEGDFFSEFDFSSRAAEQKSGIADATTILYGLLARVPKLSVIHTTAKTGADFVNDKEGKTSDNSEISNGRVPSVAFVPDAVAPLLILPNRNIELSEKDAEAAIADILLWMARNGDYDVISQAATIASTVSNLTVDNLAPVLVEVITQGAVDGFAMTPETAKNLTSVGRVLASKAKKKELTKESIERINQLAYAWARLIRRQTLQIASRDKSLSAISPDIALGITKKTNVNKDLITEESAARIVASALANPESRKLIALSMIVDPGVELPNSEEQAIFGTIVSTQSIPYLGDSITREMMTDLRDSFAAPARANQMKTLDEQEEADPESMIDEAEDTFADIAKRAGVESLNEASVEAISPLIDTQFERANAFLHDVLRNTVPSENAKPAGLALQKSNAQRKLTEMEARQLIGAFGLQYLRSVAAEQAGTPLEYLPEDGNAYADMTAEELMNLTSEVAQKLRDEYFYHKLFEGNASISWDALTYYGSFSYLGTVNYSSYSESRIKKGAAVMLNMTGKVDGETKTYTANIDELEADIASLNATRYQTIESGETISYEEAAKREYYKEKQEIDETIAAFSNAAMQDAQSLRNAEAALAAVKAAKLEFEKGNADIELLRRSVRNIVAGRQNTVAPLLDSFANDRQSISDSIALEIVRSFETQIARARVIGGGTPNIFSVSAQTAMQFDDNSPMNQLADIKDVYAPKIEMHREKIRRLLSDIERERQELAADLGLPSEAAESTLISRSDKRIDRLNRLIDRRVQAISNLINAASNKANSVLDGVMPEQQVLDIDANNVMDVAGDALFNLNAFRRFSRVSTEMAQRTIITKAIKDGTIYNPDTSLRSLDLGLFSRDRQIVFSDDIRARIERIVSRDTLSPAEKVASISRLVQRDVFGESEDTVQLVESALQSRVDELKANQSRDSEAMALVKRAASGVPRLQELDYVTAQKIILRVAKQTAESRVEQSQEDLKQSLLTQANLARRASMKRAFLMRRNAGGFEGVRFTGEPDQVEMTIRALRKYGEVYDSIYKDNIGSFEYADGLKDSEINEMISSLTLLEKADLLSDSKVQYSVSGDILVPSNASDIARDLLVKLKGIKPTDRQINLFLAKAKSDSVFANNYEVDFKTAVQNRIALVEEGIKNLQRPFKLTGTTNIELTQADRDRMIQEAKDELAYLKGDMTPAEKRMFGSTLSPLGAASHPAVNNATSKAADATFAKVMHTLGIKNYGKDDSPLKAMADLIYRQISDLDRLVTHEKGEKPFLRGKGLKEGVQEEDLHNKALSILASLSNASKETMAENLAILTDVHAKAIAAELTAETKADLVLGFLNDDVMKSSLMKKLMPQDSKLRTLFARSMDGLRAARKMFAIIDHGLVSGGGRHGHLNQMITVKERFTKAIENLKKGKQLEQSSEGYFVASIYSAIAKAIDPRRQAADLLDSFDVAFNNIQQALSQGASKATDAQGLKKALALSKDKLHLAKKWLTEETYQLLEERQLMISLVEKYKPILEGIRVGSIDLSEVRARLNAEMDKETKEYSEFIQQIFGEYKQSFDIATQMNGEQVRASQPAVPFRWSSYKKTMSESNEVSSAKDLLNFSKSMFKRIPPNRMKENSLDLLNVNGLEAPLAILGDMLYRINVAPVYRIGREYAGEAIDQNQGTSSTQVINLNSEEPGQLSESFNDDTKERSDNIKKAAGSIAIMMQQVILNDLTTKAPRSRATQAVHELALIGAMRSLISLSRIWRDTLYALVAKVVVRDGFMKNLDLLPIMSDYMGTRLLGKASAILNKSKGDPNASEKPMHEKIENFVRKHATSVLLRTANGDDIYLNRIKRAEVPKKYRVKGRLTGGARPLLDAITSPYRFFYDKKMELGTWMFQKTNGSAEKYITHPMVVHSIHKQVNQYLRTTGEKEISLQQLLDGEADGIITPYMEQNAVIAVSDIFGQSESSKKGNLFQAQEKLSMEMLRGLFTTFSNHNVSTTSNSYAGHKQRVHGLDEETRKEGRRLFASSITQNVLYGVVKYEVITRTAGVILGALLGWDDDEIDDFVGGLHGIRKGESENKRRSRLMHWMAVLIGGSAQPMGYDQKNGSWTDSAMEEDVKKLTLSAAKEIAIQSPIGSLGILASTTMGSSGLQWGTNKLLGWVLPGNVPIYERAGITIGENIKGNMAERATYDISKFFINDAAKRSTMLGGVSSYIDPFAVVSNAQGDISLKYVALLAIANIDFIPRELRPEIARFPEKEMDVKKWARTYEKR